MGSRFKKNRARTHLVNALKRKVLESKIRKSDGDRGW
jgi:hypothetical protein